MKSLVLSLVLPVVLAADTPAGISRRPAASKVAPVVAPRVEVAFVLDTTGSMSGLIEGAKRRIWSIARRIGEGRPRPELRIALVGYRDLGDAYVTRVFDLTGDMDEVYQRLSGFQAEGGGDTPEHVSAALADAVHRVSWSEGPALRIVFLVGDAPPHMDYQDGFDYRKAVAEARRRDIVVEAIQCGGDPATTGVWREIAAAGQGHYAQIDGSGGMPVRVTSVDAELGRLNAELSSTVVAGGSSREQAETESKLAARRVMAAPVAAEAAAYFAAAPKLAEKDLVDLPVEEQRKELSREPASRSAALRGKSEAEALRYLDEQKKRRQQLQGRIQELQKRRDAELSQVKDAFDEQVVDRLKTKAETQGIKY